MSESGFNTLERSDRVRMWVIEVLGPKDFWLRVRPWDTSKGQWISARGETITIAVLKLFSIMDAT